LVYVIDIITFIDGKTIINGVKKDSMGVEYGYMLDFQSIEELEAAMRKRWDIKGNIKIVKNGIQIGVLNGSL
jgi:hypothetical protein